MSTTLAEKMSDISKITKVIEGFRSKNEDMEASIEVTISYAGRPYARLTERRGELGFSLVDSSSGVGEQL